MLVRPAMKRDLAPLSASIAVMVFGLTAIGSDCGMSCPKGPFDRNFTVAASRATGPRMTTLALDYGPPVRATVTARATRPIVVVLARIDVPEEALVAYRERAVVANWVGKGGPIFGVYPILRAGAGERVAGRLPVTDTTFVPMYGQLVVIPLDEGDAPYDVSLYVEESHSKYETFERNAGCQAFPLPPPLTTLSALPLPGDAGVSGEAGP